MHPLVFLSWSLPICILHPLQPHASYPVWSPEEPRAPDPPEHSFEDTHGELRSESTAAGGPVEHHHWQRLTSRADHKQHRDLLQQTSVNTSLSVQGLWVFLAVFSPLSHSQSYAFHLYPLIPLPNDVRHVSKYSFSAQHNKGQTLVLLCSDKLGFRNMND